ncbi:MAG: imidazole glycerol phosphate synthase subunit HisH [Bacillota bacterium]|nr:imidazole glycerol phosphate synthase subunit HisH [Bacillota bacterium]
MIAIVDYGVGNLFSLAGSLSFLGLPNQITADPETLRQAERIILPGVGAFGDAAEKLRASGLGELVCREAERGKPLLGICLGMQLLLEKSYEYGEHRGLGLIPGEICPLEADLDPAAGLKVPHIGWNSLRIRKKEPLFKYVEEGDHVYYVHSYYAKNCGRDTLVASMYGVEVTGAVGRDNVYGTQFHPEKSGTVGLSILRAFSEL